MATKLSIKRHTEGTERILAFFGRSSLVEGKHQAGCACGFCKNKGNIGNWKKKTPAAEEKPEPEEPKGMAEAILHELGGRSHKPQSFVPKCPRCRRTLQKKQVCPKCGPMSESEGMVKLSKGTHPGAANLAYNKMTSKQAMTPGKKTDMYVKAAAEVAGLPGKGQVKGFKNKSEGEMTGGSAVPKTRRGESVRRIVTTLLD